MSKPWAVLISDIHYSLPTLQLADAALTQAISHAERLRTPLIIAGDLHDTKGAMRGECVAAMLATFKKHRSIPIYVLPGNHCRINEKSKAHALEFLRGAVTLVEEPKSYHGLWMIPYESVAEELQAVLSCMTHGSTLIMHTGVQTAYMGHYAQDKSSLPKESFAPFRVISGHYHRRQDIKCGFNTFSYIGNPYTLNFGEALDPPKGFQVLNTDGSLTFVPTNLRKHIALDRSAEDVMTPVPEYHPGDLVKIRVSGPQSELAKLKRKDLGDALFGGNSHFKLDLVPTKVAAPETIAPIALTVAEIMDSIIDRSGETEAQKTALKLLWRGLDENT